MRCRNRRPAPPLLLVALIALVGAASSARADYDLALDVGFDGSVRPDTWTPAYVRLTGTGVDADGEVQLAVRLRSNGSVRTYSKAVRLHAGATNELHTLYYLQPDPADVDTIIARVLADGRVVQQKKLNAVLPLQDTQPAIVVLTQEGGGLSFLSATDIGPSHRTPPRPTYAYGGAMGGMGSVAPKNQPRVIYPRPALLPDSAGGYAAVDAVMLGDLPLDILTEDQWAALVGFVHDGGVLVISGGGDINRARSQKLAGLLPISPSGVRQVRALPSLADRYESAPRLTVAPVIAGTLRSDAMALSRQDGMPIVAVRRAGNGSVLFTAFDLMAPEFRAWPGQPRLWEEALRIGSPELQATQVLRAANQQTRTYWGGDTSQGRILRDALAGAQTTETPSFGYIGAFLLLYIICLVPVNYLLLRRRDRRELAWITAPAIILLFSTGAYAVGYSIKGGQLFLRYCSVIEGTANEDAWSAYTVASIFSPRQSTYELTIADPGALPTEITESASGYERPISDIAVMRSQKTSVRNVLVNMWDHRSYDFQTHLSLGGRVSASVVPAGGDALKVQITNDTGRTLTDCQVSAPGTAQIVGTLNAGETRSLRLITGSSYPGTGFTVGAPQYAMRSTVTQISQAMANLLNGNPGGAKGAAPLVFSGWFSDQVVGLGLAGEKPRTEGVSLLVVHLPRPGSTGMVPPPVTRSDLPEPAGPTIGPTGTPPAVSGPQAASYYNNLAYSYANQGDLNAAIRAANRAMTLAPQDGNIVDSVAEMHQRRKEYRAAAQFYQKALHLQRAGGTPETHEKYGETLLALGNRQRAVQELRIAARSPSSWGARAQQALRKLGVSP